MGARVCLLLALCACVCASKPRKGFFCLDPDTGLLHGINTTWQSTTFCGNYTCKIRPVNNTMETSESRTAANTTRMLQSVLKLDKSNSNTIQDETKTEKPNLSSKDTDFLSGQEGGEAKTSVHRNSDIQPNGNNVKLPNDEGDRYLNAEEIKTISQLLHTVKKSDLEAIIEIYNLAQDIYKEMDEVDNTNANLPSQKDIPKYVKGKEDINEKIPSYWYEPYVLNEFYKLADLKPEGSEFVPAVAQKPSHNPPQPITPCFSRALLNNQDFGKLAYYYPLSQFQRLASYYRQQQRPVAVTSPPNRCNPCPAHSHPTPTPSNERRLNERTYSPSIPTQQPQQPILTPLLVPYPFSNMYNGTGLAYNNYNNYYTSNPWANYEYNKKNPYNFFNMGSNKPNTNINEEPDAKEVTEKPKEETKSWLTDPLPEELIKEMRANIAERSKLLIVPLKNRIKVEKLGKIIKLDHLNRHTRVAREVEEDTGIGENKEDFEVYIERTTCNTDTELGYFRVGNMSQPFPECCPQKIKSR